MHPWQHFNTHTAATQERKDMPVWHLGTQTHAGMTLRHTDTCWYEMPPDTPLGAAYLCWGKRAQQRGVAKTKLQQGRERERRNQSTEYTQNITQAFIHMLNAENGNPQFESDGTHLDYMRHYCKFVLIFARLNFCDFSQILSHLRNFTPMKIYIGLLWMAKHGCPWI